MLILICFLLLQSELHKLALLYSGLDFKEFVIVCSGHVV